MKLVKKVLAVTLIGISGLVGSTMIAQAQESKTNDELAVVSASVTLEQALNVAKSAIPGTLAKIKYSNDEGAPVWEVEVIDANQTTHDLEISATTGQVVKQKVDKADKSDNENDDENDGKDDKEEND